MFCAKVHAQEVDQYPPYVVMGEDTVRVYLLNPVYWQPVPKYNSKSWKEYRKLVHNFKKVYPYALAAKERMDKMDEELSQIKSKKEREQKIDQYEKDLFSDFEQPIRNLTYSQGRLLLKLVDREVGQTSYYVIKDLKGGFKAFFWQGIARFFGADLKKPYDKYGEDRDVEKLVKMYQEGTFNLLCAQLGV